MLLFVGLIPFAHRNRETSQESGIKAWFDTGAKRAMVLDHAERASEIVAEAMLPTMSGRPGPACCGGPAGGHCPAPRPSGVAPSRPDSGRRNVQHGRSRT